MIKHTIAALAAVALLTAPAMAAGYDEDVNAPESGTTSEAPSSEVAGVRLVPSVLAKDVFLTPSAWYQRGEGRNANANARVYTDREGAITGVTVTAWGLPNPERVNSRYNDYVVWLVDTQHNQMKNIGVLESRNGGKAVFGFTPEQPLEGFDRIMITPEPTFAVGSPSGFAQLSAPLPTVASRPTTPSVD